MDSGRSRREVRARRLPTAVKIVVAGGFGVGKTTMVGTVSETQPLRTEELLTDESVGVDDMAGVERKKTTTVAMDFGRITMRDDYVLYLFGTPGQERFWFMWDEVALGALGAVVLADTRRLSDCFPSVDYFERRSTPFVVAVNCFEGARSYELEEIQLALNLGPKVPVMLCDARELGSCKQVLIDLVLHAMKSRGVTETPQSV
ncbi:MULTISPECIES: GTP-binding protein [Actinomadura]|uniref:ATP-binding protein n=1 Tax=Actinomadura litoris TaxID=2678616 RepID=A0A7K1LDG1_9ACTN|nr:MULTISPECIES: ATP/GTP-binding protein [Actinomadura]MBT2210273.1 ATP/GTP-binding protein [Actinomadura sp. NEAU-AAG7]MUN42462.1 ATP-binding protein [Actinomadura litoris]